MSILFRGGGVFPEPQLQVEESRVCFHYSLIFKLLVTNSQI